MDTQRLLEELAKQRNVALDQLAIAHAQLAAKDQALAEAAEDIKRMSARIIEQDRNQTKSHE